MSIAFGLLVLRLVVGLTIAAHGAQKLFGVWGGPGMNGWTQVVQRLRMRPARPLAWIAALSEFGGGLLLALGLLSPLGNLAIIGSMLVAIATVHLSKGFWVTKGGFEFNLTLIGAAAALAITGPAADSACRNDSPHRRRDGHAGVAHPPGRNEATDDLGRGRARRAGPQRTERR